MLESIANGFMWGLGVILFFVAFGITILIVLMGIRKLTDIHYNRAVKK